MGDRPSRRVLGIADVDVTAIVAVHGGRVPWSQARADGVTVIPARRVPDLLQASPPILGPERVAYLADLPSNAAISPATRRPASCQEQLETRFESY